MAFSVTRLLRKVPVAEQLKEVGTFINRELLPYLHELRESLKTAFETPSDGLDFIGDTEGSILVRDADEWTEVVPGTTNYPLVSNGTGELPAYERLTNAGLSEVATRTVKGRTSLLTGDSEDMPLLDTDTMTWNVSTAGSLAMDAVLGGKDSVVNVQTATNSTTALVNPYTVAANTFAIGQVWRARSELNFIHTAAATPEITCQLLIAGISEIGLNVIPIANAGTYSGYVEAIFTVVATNEIRCSIHAFFSDDVQAEQFGGSNVEVANSGIADMTASQTITLQVNMATAVASNTLALTQGWIERIFG